MTDEDIGEQATDLANEIEKLVAGRPTVVVYLALSMVIGANAAKAPRPNLKALLKTIGRSARNVFDFERQYRCVDQAGDRLQ